MLGDVIEPISLNIHSGRPSDKKFGLFIVALLLIFAILCAKKAIHGSSLFYSILAVLILLVSLLKPRLLIYLNIAWYQFGRIIGKITNPIILGVIYFLFLTPTAIISRIFKRDVLKLQGMNLETLWVERSPQQSGSQYFEGQF